MATATNTITKKRRGLFFFSAGFDMPFFLLVILILAVGLVSLFSASFAYAYYWNNGDSYYYIKRQLVFAGLGIAFMLLASTIDYRFWKRKIIPWAVLGLAGLLLVIVLFLPEIQNVHRWIRLGPRSLPSCCFSRIGHPTTTTGCTPLKRVTFNPWRCWPSRAGWW